MPTESPDITRAIAEYVSNAHIDDFSQETIQAAKAAIIDSFACMLAGSCEPIAAVLCRYISEEGGRPAASIIGKSIKSASNKAINIADKGKSIKPNKMVGIWGEDWKRSPTNDSQRILWDDFYDSMIYAPAIDDGNEIFLNEQFKNEVMDGGVVRPFRHSLSISHLLQSGKLEKLKEGLINGAKG